MEKTYVTQVYEVTRLIPYGKVSTYGAIADYLALGSARMVGWALNKVPGAGLEVPAHRVVNRNGVLSGSGHFPTPTMMQELLEQEGVEIVDHKIVNFEKHLWKPSEMLS